MIVAYQPEIFLFLMLLAKTGNNEARKLAPRYFGFNGIAIRKPGAY